MISRNLE